MAQIDFATLGNLANDYRTANRAAAREQSPLLAQYGGDIGLAQFAMQRQQQLLANQHNERDFGFRQQEVTRAQGNTDRTFQFQREQAEAAARGFETREYEKSDGTKGLVRIEKATGKPTPLDIGGGADQPNNPFAQGKMNESQSKMALYAGRILQAEQILRDPVIVEAATRPQQHLIGRAAGGTGLIGMAANSMLSPEYQKYDQAKRDFVNAVLRPESGAVISEAEFANAEKQYFPQPGDDPSRLKQKEASRAAEIRGIAAAAGPGFRPDFVFDQTGKIVANPKPQATGGPVRVGSPADRDKLAPGTSYIAPDGSTRIKQ